MIPSGVQLFVALEPIDMRWSFDRLAGIAEEQVGYNARCGARFVFFGKRWTALRILFADGTGLAILYKRLAEGTFLIPEAATSAARHLEIERSELDSLLDGVEIERKTH